MISGFEDITYDLTDYELKLVDDFVVSFKKRVGPDNAITSREIISILKNKGYQKLNGARVRKIINYIRRTRLVKNLIASSKGYYVETDPGKVEEYKQSLLQRAHEIILIAESYL